MRERQREYELLFIISPLRASEEDVNATIARVSQSVTSIGGEVTSVDHSAPWGRRKLAYPIRRFAEGEAGRRSFTEGYYVLLRFNLLTSRIDEFDRQLKLNDAVIRHLITLVDLRGQQNGSLNNGAILEPVIDDIEGDDAEGGDEE